MLGLHQKRTLINANNLVWSLLLLLSFSFQWARSKEYQRCELLTELTAQHRIPLKEAAKLTCYGVEAAFRTDYVKQNESYGIFGVDCQNCDDKNCSLFLDDDITDDLKCARNKNITTEDCEKEIIVNCYGNETISEIISPNNCSTNICHAMTSASGQSLQTMLAAIVANLDSILYDPCEAVFALHQLRGISPREIGTWACVIMDFVKCANLHEGEPDCKIGDCARIETQYGIKKTHLCTEIVEAINDSYVLLNETITQKILLKRNCLEWIPDTVEARCQMNDDRLFKQEDATNDEQLIFNNMLELLDKEKRGVSIEDINQLEIISNSSYDPSTLDPCVNLIAHFNPNISTDLSVSWLCFSRENVNCYRREHKMCFTANCSTLTENDLKSDPNCQEHIQKVANFININEEAIMNTPERPLDDCKVEAHLFLQDCLYNLGEKRRMEEFITTDETRYGVPYSLTMAYIPTTAPVEAITTPPESIDSNIITSMGLALQVNESHLMVQDTFERFLGDPCHVKTVLDETHNEEYLASMFCFAYDVLWCSSNEVPLKCNVDCKTVKDNVIQDDTKCVERLNQIIMVGEKMQKILGLANDEYSPNCMNSFIGFIASCRVLTKGVPFNNKEEPLYTRWSVRPTIQTRFFHNTEEPSKATEASVSIFSGGHENMSEEELMTIRITTKPSTTTELNTQVDIQTTTETVEIEPASTLVDTFATINACDLYRNSTASETEFANTFCAIYENAWCRLINSEGDCTVPCSSLNFDDDTELCDETLTIMYSISGMWTKIFMEEKLTYIPQCHIWAKKNLGKCNNNSTELDLPVLQSPNDDEINDEERNAQQANTVAKERLCGIMRTFHDIYLVEEDQRSGWYCFAFDIFSCTIGRNTTVNCPVNCHNALDSFIKADVNCEKRYRYVEDIAITIDNRFMIENHNIKPADCRKDLRKILRVCNILLEDFSTTTEILQNEEKLEIEDHNIAFETLKSLDSVTEASEVDEKTESEVTTKTTTTSTTTIKPSRKSVVHKTFDYSIFFPKMSCSKLYNLYEGISKDPEVISSYTCFYIDYIFCTVNDPDCAVKCSSIEYDLPDRDACEDLLESIDAKMDDFSSIVSNLTHIAEDCKPYYRKYLNECPKEETTTVKITTEPTTTEKVETKPTTEATTTEKITTTTTTTTEPEVPSTTEAAKTQSTTTKAPLETTTQLINENSGDETSFSDVILLRETISHMHPPSFDFTDSQQIEDDPIVCDKLYSLKAYLNIQPDVVISYYCFLQDYVLCKEQDPECDLNCRNVNDDDVQNSPACQKLVLSISRNRKHAHKYKDDGFTGSVEECKTRNSIACTELADKYFITSTTIRTTTKETEKVSLVKSTTEKITEKPVTKKEVPPTVHFASRNAVSTTEIASTVEEIRTTTTTTTPIPTTTTTTTPIPTTTTTEAPEIPQETTISVDYPYYDDSESSEDISFNEKVANSFADPVILTDHLNFCHLKDIFVHELGNADPSVLVSYFCFMQDYISCLNEDENCKINCDTTEDESLRSTELCRNAVTFVNEMRVKVPMIVTQRVDLAVCKKSLKNMFDGCDLMTSSVTEVPTTTEILAEEIPTTTVEAFEEPEKVTPKIINSSNSPQGPLIVKQNSMETPNLADFFTIGIMHPKSMAKANFQIGLKEAQIKNIVITPDTDNSNFNVAFTFHVDEEENQQIAGKTVEN